MKHVLLAAGRNSGLYPPALQLDAISSRVEGTQLHFTEYRDAKEKKPHQLRLFNGMVLTRQSNKLWNSTSRSIWVRFEISWQLPKSEEPVSAFSVKVPRPLLAWLTWR